MTELKGDASVTRKVQSTDHHGRQLVVTLHAKRVEVRAFGTRQAYTLSYESILHEAARLQADRARAERAALKKLRQRSKR